MAHAGCWMALATAAMALEPDKTLDQYVYWHWGTAEGFVGGNIYSIAQSADGFLWIGTDRGLVRFDGRSFTLIQRPLSSRPPLGRVRELRADSSGQLWIRAEGIHLLLYKDGEFHDPFSAFHLEDAAFTAAALDQKGRLLLTGLGRSTLRFEKGGFKVLADSMEIPGTIMALAESRDERVWMGTRDGGLYRLDRDRILPGSNLLGNAKINALLSAHNGGLWIGTDHGVQMLTAGGMLRTLQQGPAAKSQILTLAHDNNGSIWAGSSLGLIRITPAEQQSLRAGSGPSHRVAAVFEDGDGNLWFGGEGGLECLRDGVFSNFLEDRKLHPARTGPLYADAKGRIWFAPVSGGLMLLENGTIRPVHLPGLNNDVIYSIDGRQNEIWLGRQKGGLTRITLADGEPSATTFTRADGLAQNSVYSVHVGKDGRVWAGTLNGGLSILRNGALRTFNSQNGLSSNTVNSIVEDHEGAIWVATPLGLDEYRMERWRTWGVAEGLPSSDVRLCFADAGGALWIATADGLAVLQNGHVEVPRALPDVLQEQILGIVADRFGFLWFSTADHLLRAPQAALRNGTLHEADLQLYAAAEGILETGGIRRERSMASDEQGRIWISVNGGVAVADPAPKYRDSLAIPVRIESLFSSGVVYSPLSSPRIPAGSRDVTIHYEAGMLTAQDRVRYRYKLDRVDKDWSQPIAAREIRYGNLAPGKYSFQIAASRDGILWNSPATTVTFTIDRAFWQTWWFRIAALSALALFALAVLRLRTIALARQLHARFQERLNERARIAQELHDTLLQSFQGLMLRFQTVGMLLPDRPAAAQAELDEALNRADQALREGREAIEGIREPSEQELDLVASLNTMLVELSGDHAQPSGSRPESSVIVEGTPRKISPLSLCDIERIAREAIHNCFQHSKAKRIEVEIAFSKSHLRICVRDDGIGIDPAVLQRGSRAGHWGLIGMKERAKRLRARVSIWSRPGAGTELELKVPAEVAYGHEPSPRTRKATEPIWR